ncbi:MAG: hypothetical protein R2795_23885 [Saprospiraceae bacterium]
MRWIPFTLSCCLLLASVELNAQLRELPYASSANDSLPAWVQLMYSAEADPGEVMEAYRAYYADHPFVKNGHTQYLKRWLREMETYEYQRDAANMTEEERAEMIASERTFWTTTATSKPEGVAVGRALAVGLGSRCRWQELCARCCTHLHDRTLCI